MININLIEFSKEITRYKLSTLPKEKYKYITVRLKLIGIDLKKPRN